MASAIGVAELDGAGLYYEIAGRGAPLVLIHGFPLDASMWEAQFAAFVRDFRVLRYDVRGFGRSSVPADQPYSHAVDLRALLDHLDMGAVHLIGLSMGGQIALDFALAYPERARTLVSVDSGPTGYAFSAEWNRLMEPIWRAPEGTSVEEKKRRWLAHPMFAPAFERQEVGEHMQRMVESYSGWHWQHKNPVRWSMPPAAERLEEIRIPTLLLVGERDLPDIHAIADLLEARLPRVQRAVLAGVGHMANMEAPERFNTLVREFLAAHSEQLPGPSD